MPNPQPLPPAWVERLFERFSAAFGAMKVGTMWPAEDHETVKALWSEQLGRFSPETLRAALQAVVDSGRAWPPTLPEFVEQCRQCALGRVQHAAAAALPRPDVPREVVDDNLRSIGEAIATVKPRPGREWAHKIVARVQTGECVPYTVHQMALRAIGAQEEPA